MSRTDTATARWPASMGIAAASGLVLGSFAAWTFFSPSPAGSSAERVVSARDDERLLDGAMGSCDQDRQLDRRLVQRHRLSRARAQSEWTLFTTAHGEPATAPDPLPLQYEPEAIGARLGASFEPGTFVLNCEFYPCIAQIRRPTSDALATANEDLVARLGYPNAVASGTSFRGPTSAYAVTTVYFFVDPPTPEQRHWGSTLYRAMGNPFPDPD